MSEECSFPKNKIKILLLENIHPAAVSRLTEAGYAIETVSRSLTPEELLEKIPDVHVLGIRSRTKIAAEHIQAARRLMAIGCFGVGTNQVALDAATTHGVPVFNAPYGNTRSVAELALGHMIYLARKAGDRNNRMHQGLWDKTAKGMHELRGKVLGIVGYGHIGQQVGILAEAIGLRVVFYDRMRQLPLGNSRQLETMDELLEQSDFVTLHVPGLKSGASLIGAAELKKMKKGSYLLNTSRGTHIDLAALKEAVQSGHLGGAALDVFPAEPKSNNEPFQCELTGVENIIMTPHLGGSTEEAQYNIGQEVAGAFVKFIDVGSTVGAVNFPQVDLPFDETSHRILNVHKNVPGVLSEVNRVISSLDANVNAQYLSTYKDIGYLVMDVNKDVSDAVKSQISELSSSIKTRILY